MKPSLLLLFLGWALSGSTQTLADLHTVELRILKYEADTIRMDLKFDKAGRIKYLEQCYDVIENGKTYVYWEEYRRGRFWYHYRLEEVPTKWKDGEVTASELSTEGTQYRYDEEGRIWLVYHFVGDELVEPIYEYGYYANGQLQFIVELRDYQVYNFVEYFDTDGQDFDYGDFRDGVGDFLMLDEAGNPCLSCAGRKKLNGKLASKQSRVKD
ncbi:MAG: hypothetical protein AAFR05_13615 [Bacteroidota bacterium]